MKTEKVVTLQGKMYMYPSEAKRLLKCIEPNPEMPVEDSKLYIEFMNGLHRIANMDIGDEVT